MDRLDPDRQDLRGAFWDASGRARRYGAMVAGTGGEDPFFSRIRRATTSRSTVVDVGAGTGRFALAIAPRVAEVVAVDPSTAMLDVLRREARRLGIANVRVMEHRWQDAAVPVADVVLCSYVLPLVEDARGFLAKMDETCRGRSFVYMSAFPGDAVIDPFWRHYHGSPRRPSPTYLDAVAVLQELGLDPDVEIVEARPMARFKTRADAVRSYRDNLLLPDTPAVRAELRGLLAPWLVEERGVLRPPISRAPAAIISWRSGSR